MNNVVYRFHFEIWKIRFHNLTQPFKKLPFCGSRQNHQTKAKAVNTGQSTISDQSNSGSGRQRNLTLKGYPSHDLSRIFLSIYIFKVIKLTSWGIRLLSWSWGYLMGLEDVSTVCLLQAYVMSMLLVRVSCDLCGAAVSSVGGQVLSADMELKQWQWW